MNNYKSYDNIGMFYKGRNYMKKVKFITTIFTMCMMICLGTFAVYALTSSSLVLPNKNISFTASDDLYYNVKITHEWLSDTIEFGIDNTSGSMVTKTEDSAYLEEIKGGYNIAYVDGVSRDIVFEDIVTPYETTYQITNNGDATFTLKISGIVYDNIEEPRYITKLNNGEEIEINSNTSGLGIELLDGICNYSVDVAKGQTVTIGVIYQLARINSSIDVDEQISIELIKKA